MDNSPIEGVLLQQHELDCLVDIAVGELGVEGIENVVCGGIVYVKLGESFDDFFHLDRLIFWLGVLLFLWWFRCRLEQVEYVGR